LQGIVIGFGKVGYCVYYYKINIISTPFIADWLSDHLYDCWFFENFVIELWEMYDFDLFENIAN